MRLWTVEAAQADLPQIIEHAMTIGPQAIGQNDEALVVVVASKEWEELNKSISDTEFFDPIPETIAGMKHFVCG